MSFVTISRNRDFVQSVLARDVAEIAAQEAEIQRRVKQDVAKLREAAAAEARDEAQAAARAALQAQQEKLATAIESLEQAAAQLAAPLARKEQDLAALVLEMALLLARHIAGGESGNASTELAGLVRHLLQEAAAERGPRQTLRLRLNAADLSVLQGKLSEDGLTLTADDAITPGGAMLELLTEDGDKLDKTEWDASLEGRFAALRTALALPGKDPA